MSKVTRSSSGVIPPGGGVQTLQGNVGAPVPPNGANNIFIVGDGITVSTIGDPAGSTINLTTPGLPHTFHTDNGDAVVVLNALSIVGDDNITTNGMGPVVKVTLNDNIVIPGNIEISGNFDLPYTTTTVGIMKMEGMPWIHNYCNTFNGRNFFAGGDAGNFTLTGDANVAISGGFGNGSLSNITTGSNNVCVGTFSGLNVTDASSCTFIGFGAGLSVTTNSGSTAVGTSALFGATGPGNCAVGAGSNIFGNTGSYNLSVGTGVLPRLSSAGSYNTIIGAGQPSVATTAGYNYTTGSPSNNILLCHPGVSAESNVMRLGNTGTGTMLVNKCFIAAIYNNTTIGVTNHVVSVDSNGQLGLASVSPGAVTSVTGTANQITASPTTGAVILTIPSTFIAPGSIAATTTVTATLGDVTITSGNVAITAATTSSVGQVTQAGNRLIHTYGGDGAGDDTNSNIFVGQLAGNFTLKVAANFGGNVSLGYNTLLSLDGGTENVAIGNKALKLLTGANNGSSGYRNTAVGTGALAVALTSRYCVGIGYHAGASLASSEHSDIYINNSGVVAESNCLRIGAGAGTGEGQLNKAVIYGIYNIAVGSTNHVVSVDSNGQLGLASNPQFFTWTTVTGTTQALAVNNGYVLNNAGLVTATLPATAVVGDRIEITGLGAGGWLIAQNASQLVRLGSSVTTTGTGGSLASTNRYDSLTLICIVTNTTWTVMGPVGNITVV